MQRNDPDDTEAPERDGLAANVSVVMVSYWTGSVLTAAIESVLAPDQEGLLELILVDNGNPHVVLTQLTLLAADDPRIVLVTGHGNVGFARGCNIGAQLARGQHLLLLNPDCILAPGAIPTLLAEAGTLGGDWLLGCRMFDPDGNDQRGSRRALLTPGTALVESFRLDRLAPKLLRRHRLNHHEHPVSDRTSRVPAVSGACMMFPVTTFRAVGGMDEGYFLHVEDLDLFLRLHRRGIPVHFAPRATAVHHGGTSRCGPVRIEWLKTRGFLRYFAKHYRGLHWILVTAPLGIAILCRFAIRATRLLLRSAAS